MLVVPLFLLQNTKALRLATTKLTGISSYMHLSTRKLAMPRQQQAPEATSHVTRTYPSEAAGLLPQPHAPERTSVISNGTH